MIRAIRAALRGNIVESTTRFAEIAGKHCIAPLEGGELCGAIATETRIVEDLVCPLCDEHAREIDDDAAPSAPSRLTDMRRLDAPLRRSGRPMSMSVPVHIEIARGALPADTPSSPDLPVEALFWSDF